MLSGHYFQIYVVLLKTGENEGPSRFFAEESSLRSVG